MTDGSAWTTAAGTTDRDAAAGGPVATSAPTAAWTSSALPGAVYGEPLIWDGSVYVATEADTVEALSATTGADQWSLTLGTPVPAGDLPCGDISPTVGVTSTMVIDPTTGTLFASAELLGTDGAVHHDLFAVDLATHRVAWSRDLDQPGWAAADQLQRTGLALDGDEVLVGFGGNYGDCGRYHGWVVGVPVSGQGGDAAYQVPTANQGAIWAPSGITVGSTGTAYVDTGNGSATAGQPFDHGDAVIALSPALQEVGVFAPTDWATLNADDLDLGSSAPVVVAGDRLLQIGKPGVAYLLDAADLGGIGGQLADLSVCFSSGGVAVAGADAYVPCLKDGTLAEVVVGTGSTLTAGWTWSAPDGGVGSPTVAYGAVWLLDAAAGTLEAVDPATGATRWSLPVGIGTIEHFEGVSAADGLLVVAGGRAVEAVRP